MKRTVAMIGVAALLLSACDGAGKETGQNAEQEPTENRALLDAAQRPLERAHEVEDIGAGRKGDLDEQIESAAK